MSLILKKAIVGLSAIRLRQNHVFAGNGNLEQPTGGSITVNGVSPSAARQAAYGYVFQAAGLYPWRGIGGNIRLPLEIKGQQAEQAERVKNVLELVELSDFEKISMAIIRRDAAARFHRRARPLMRIS